MATWVRTLQGTDTSDATATASQILNGFTAYADGTKITGNIAQRSASSQAVVGSKTYDAGYYPDGWTVTGLNTSDATATAAQILSGYTAYIASGKVDGSYVAPDYGVTIHVMGSYSQTPYNTNVCYRITHSGIQQGSPLLYIDGNAIRAYSPCRLFGIEEQYCKANGIDMTTSTYIYVFGHWLFVAFTATAN